tara:strand:+ start:4219 stop:6273 length:2055 start_codon:yes stop_codon:yes gene_type:complete
MGFGTYQTGTSESNEASSPTGYTSLDEGNGNNNNDKTVMAEYLKASRARSKDAATDSVAKLYAAALGRQPAPEALAHYVKKVQDAGGDTNQVLKELVASTEGKKYKETLEAKANSVATNNDDYVKALTAVVDYDNFNTDADPYANRSLQQSDTGAWYEQSELPNDVINGIPTPAKVVIKIAKDFYNQTLHGMDDSSADKWMELNNAGGDEWSNMSAADKANLARDTSVRTASTTNVTSGGGGTTDTVSASGNNDTVSAAADATLLQETGATATATNNTLLTGGTDAEWLQAQYQREFGRDIGSAGLDFYTEEMNKERKTRAEVLADLRFSKEGQLNDTAQETQLKALYTDVLKRDLGQSGSDFYSDKMLNEGWTIENVRADVLNSQEYANLPTDGTGTGTSTGTTDTTGNTTNTEVINGQTVTTVTAADGTIISKNTGGVAGSGMMGVTGVEGDPTSQLAASRNPQGLTFNNLFGSTRYDPDTGQFSQSESPEYANFQTGLLGQLQSAQNAYQSFDPTDAASEYLAGVNAIREPLREQQTQSALSRLVQSGKLGATAGTRALAQLETEQENQRFQEGVQAQQYGNQMQDRMLKNQAGLFGLGQNVASQQFGSQQAALGSVPLLQEINSFNREPAFQQALADKGIGAQSSANKWGAAAAFAGTDTGGDVLSSIWDTAGDAWDYVF